MASARGESLLLFALALFLVNGSTRLSRQGVSQVWSSTLSRGFAKGRRLERCRSSKVADDAVGLADKIFAKAVVEYPTYKTLERRPTYKVRLYPKSVAVQVKRDSQMSPSDQLQLLADYIGVGTDNPANSESAKVAITAPILMPGAVVVGISSKSLQLVLPADYELSDVPTPTDKRLQLVEIPEHVCAVQAVVKKNNLESQLDVLVNMLQKDQHTVDRGSWQVLHYRSPWFNPMFNSDEIAVGLKKYTHCRENRDTLWCHVY
ncbi:hypothetical protein AAMO2058_000796400 [Amorphochlora amoebiformis]